jgi:uncharacterized protein
MTEETARAAVDLAVQISHAQGGDQSLGIVFFGGEPLLLPHLIRKTILHCLEIEHQTGQLFHFKLTTNGSLLDASFLTDPLTSRVFVALSHDGIQPAQDAHRVDACGNSTFEKLNPVVDILLKHKPYAPAMLVTTPETVQWYAESVQFLFSRGFRYLICSLNYSVPWPRHAIKELERQYEKLSQWYEAETDREEKFYFSPFDVKIASHVFPGSCRRDRCELGRRQISVAPTGRLFPCVQFVGNGEDSEWCIGDVQTGLNEARREQLYQENAKEKTACRQCAIRERCNHYCGCLNRQATGDLGQVSPVLCAHEQIVVRVADRMAERLFRRKNAMFIQKQYNELFPLVSLAEDHTAQKNQQENRSTTPSPS